MASTGSHRMVGRDAELARLRSILQAVAEGAPAVVVVSGETGIGKTRLVSDFVSGSDVFALAGACVPVAGAALPFAPIAQALRTLATRLAPATRARLGSGWPGELARLLPATEAGEAAVRRASPTESPLTASTQLRLFESVLSLARALGEVQPVALLVEDVHWADPSTLDLLRFLADNLTDERLLIVLTYRSDQVAERSTVAPWLAELGRLPRSHRVTLERLDEVDTGQLVADVLGATPDPDLLASVRTRSDGNPLFVEHLLASGGHTGDELPRTLHDLLKSRVAGLPDETRRLLRAASVVGRVARLPLLSAVVEESEPVVEERLRPALNAWVVEPRGSDSFGFRHPAFREVVYAELLPGERLRLHRSAALALERHRATGEVAGAEAAGEIARHWEVVGDVPAALRSAVEAGFASERSYAFADAHLNFRRAVALVPTAGTAVVAEIGVDPVAPMRMLPRPRASSVRAPKRSG